MPKLVKFLALPVLAIGAGILLYHFLLHPGTEQPATEPPVSAKPHPRSATADAPVPAKEHLVAEFHKLLELEGPIDLDAWSNLLDQFIQRDPNAIADMVQKLPGTSPNREFLMHRVAQKWAAADPQGAITWAKSIYTLNERDQMVGSVCYEIAQRDPLVALQTVESCDPPIHTVGIYQGLVSQLAEQDFAQALEWSRSHLDQAARNQLLQSLAFTQAQTDPEGAAILVADTITASTTQGEAALSVILQWAKTDPSAARTWAKSFPDENLRQRALQEISSAENSPPPSSDEDTLSGN